MDRTEIDLVRSFNRTITERVGVLHESYLGRDRPIGQARLLWEIGGGDGRGGRNEGGERNGRSGRDVRQLRERLGLDSGYLSRLLHALAADGLVTVRPSPADQRVRCVELTGAGRAERALLDELSDDLASSLLAPLNPAQRARLTTAMAEVERLLTAAVVTVREVDPDHPDARHCLRAYYAELSESFGEAFDPLRTTLPDPSALRAPHGLFLLARLHDAPVGCAGLRLPADAKSAEIKRMWVAPEVRGLGLARRFLAELETAARERGRTVLRLDTHRSLTPAIALYRSAGFVEIPAFNDDPYAQMWFEKPIPVGS